MPNPNPGTCQAESASMLCMLPEDHGGLHYDDIDDITWKEGRPDA